MSPYIYMLVLLPLVRYGFPAVVPNGFAVMCTFGYIFWVDVVILVCGMLGAATLGVSCEAVPRGLLAGPSAMFSPCSSRWAAFSSSPTSCSPPRPA